MPVPLLPQQPTENGAVIFVAQPFLAVLPHTPPTPDGYSPIAIRSVRIFFLVGFH